MALCGADTTLTCSLPLTFMHAWPTPVSCQAAEYDPCGCTQAAAKTNDTAGDGTTTATILSAAIIAEGMKIVAAGTNPVQV